jgi:hypothetical protein
MPAVWEATRRRDQSKLCVTFQKLRCWNDVRLFSQCDLGTRIGRPPSLGVRYSTVVANAGRIQHCQDGRTTMLKRLASRVDLLR